MARKTGTSKVPEAPEAPETPVAQAGDPYTPWEEPFLEPDSLDTLITTAEGDHAIPQVESGDILSSPITDNEVDRVLQQVQIDDIRKAFSGSYFSVRSIPHDYNETAPADRLVSKLHCKDFKDMSEDTKILLYRACLQLCDLSSEDFPYPFGEEKQPEKETLLLKIPETDKDHTETETTHYDHAAPLCPFGQSDRINELTQNWSRSDRRELRHAVKKHVVVAAGISLIIGIVVGALLSPADNRTTINLPRENGPVMQRDSRSYMTAPHAEAAQITPVVPQPSRSALITQASQGAGIVVIPQDKGN